MYPFTEVRKYVVPTFIDVFCMSVHYSVFKEQFNLLLLKLTSCTVFVSHIREVHISTPSQADLRPL